MRPPPGWRLLPAPRRSGAAGGGESGGASVLGLVDVAARRFVDRVVDINRLLQRGIWLRLATVGLFVGVALVLSWWMMPDVEYLPTGNRNLVITVLLPPPGYSIDRSL